MSDLNFERYSAIYKLGDSEVGHFHKYMIVKSAEMLGDEELINRTCHVLFPRKNARLLKRWRDSVSSFPEEVTHEFREVLNGQALSSDCHYAKSDLKTYSLIMQDAFRQQRSSNNLDSKERAAFKKYIRGGTLRRFELRRLQCGALVDSNGELTSIGAALELQSRNVAAQCHEVGVFLRHIEVLNNPVCVEELICTSMPEGGEWYYVENSIWSTLVRDLSARIGVALIKEHPGISIYSMQCIQAYGLGGEFLAAFTPELFNDYIAHLRAEGLPYLISHDDRGYGKTNTVIPNEVLIRILYAIGFSRVLSILERYTREPKSCLRGWPDLLGVKSGEIYFVEVKGRDKLTLGQLESFAFINKLFEGRLEVYKVKIV